ncbi:hypothetical protein MMC30_007950 [Trapelia coarctata]|nr:hypothetical protein [Trapelia coarctata]
MDTPEEDVAEDMQAMQTMQEFETSSPGPGPRTRRRRGPGNLWTLEAREDMFRRREAGEGWETIILDYPNRSRHAMQQQYSMMKKQIAIADGTWVSNRRGRKRKAPEDNWPSVNKQPRWEEYEGEDDETEDDEFGDPEAGESEDVEDDYVAKKGAVRAVPRPPLPVRSATDPVPRPTRSHFPTPSGLQPAQLRQRLTAPDSSKTSTDNEGFVRESSTPTDSRKRRKLSDDAAMNSPAMMPAQDSPGIAGDEDELVVLQEGFSQILKRATEKARIRVLEHEAEKSSQYKMFEASVTRANRRAEEAEERLRITHHQYGESAKIEREQKAYEIKVLKEDFEKKRKAQVQEVEERLRLAQHQYAEDAKLERERNANEIKALKENFETDRKVQRQEFEEKLLTAHQDGEVATRQREQNANEIRALAENFARDQKAQAETHSQKTEAQQHIIDALQRTIDSQRRTIETQQKEREESDKTYQRDIAGLKAQLQAAEKSARSPEYEERLHTTIADLQKQLSVREEQSEILEKARLNRSKSLARQQQSWHNMAESLSRIHLQHGKLSASLLRLDKDLEDMGMKAIRKAVGQLVLDIRGIDEWLNQAKQSVMATSPSPNPLEDSAAREDGPPPTNGAGNHKILND